MAKGTIMATRTGRQGMQKVENELFKVVTHPFLLLVVADKMFSAGPDALALDTLDFGRRKLASKVRILAGHVFEVAAIQRYPVKIHARSSIAK